ncbi:transglycosylase SLT domain-containing protein [Cupriavidus sp. DB3]|uniref:transglycosylase SLT domain-containing protein n=1 Tax=Cupriavidus sp. DB3 TaxID=2873259 RepID=UPI0027154F8F|nr:transglycosylase SLT domain-containing protein [Cupriavidus sp. DB3]
MTLTEFLRQEAQRQGVDPALAARVMQTESGGRADAVSPKGAIGPMQLMPATARELGVNINDPYDNIRGGIRYLRKQLDAFGTPELALAAYNAGPGAVRKHGGIPPYAETQNYVRKIMPTTDDSDIFGSLAPAKGASDDSDIFAMPGKTGQPAARQDVRSAASKEQPQVPTNPSRLKGSVAGALFMGIRDGVDAGAQLARRAVPEGVARAIDDFGNTLADYGFPVARSNGVEGVDALVRRANQDYEASRKLAGRDGIDIARIGGNIANPINRIVPMGAATAGGVAARAGLQGAISGLATPVLNTESFGTNKAAQVGLGAITGAGSGYAADKVLGMGGRAFDSAKRTLTPQATRAQAVAEAEAQVARAAAEQGIDLAAIPQSILTGVKKQVSDAFATGKTVDARALLRKAEGDAVLGKERGLTLGQVTRDPQQFTREMNLRGVDGVGAPLAQRFGAQNQGLIDALNARGAAAAPGEFAAGQSVVDNLRRVDSALRDNEANLYGRALSMNANEIPLDHRQFADRALSVLDQQMKIGFLPPQITKIVNDISQGKLPLNISTSEQIKTTLAEATRLAKRSGDGNTVRALAIVRDALEQTRPSTPLGKEAQAAFDAARAAARERFETIEAIPALKAAVDDMAPDKFFQKHVLAAPVRDVQAMIGLIPEQTDMLRKQTLEHLKSKALNGAADEVGKFSQSNYNKALREIGETKLRALFPAEEVETLKSIGRVASYIQAQPVGSAVNNSNSGAAVMNLFSQLSGKLGSLPVVNIARNSVNQFLDERAAAAALAGKVPAQAKEPSVNALRPYLLPFAAQGGLLGAYMGQ